MKKVEKNRNYRRMNKEQLENELKNLSLEMMKAKTKMGHATIGKDKEKGSSGSDIIKRIRREKARILTILREKEN